MSIFGHEIRVSFGDCDPAGIVFYPNYFRWMDATFHAFLSARTEGHAALCSGLGARGLGLMEAGMSFRSPLSEGRILEFSVDGLAWANRHFDVTYAAHSGGKLVLEGRERRGVFVESDGRMTAGNVAGLKDILDR